MITIDMPKKKALKPDKKRFIKKYIQNGGNATQACREVYPNITYDSAKDKGCQLLTYPYIKSEVELISESKGVGLPEVLENLNKILVNGKNPSDQINAMRLWLKTCGRLIEKHETKSTSQNLTVNLTLQREEALTALRGAYNELKT